MLDKGVERRGPPKPAGFISRTLTVIGQLILPVLFLLFALAAVWAVRGEQATDFRFLKQLDPSLDPASGDWLTWGVLLLPVSFFVLNLTSRRYGPSIAFGSVVIAWAIIGGGIYWGLSRGVIASFESEIAPVPLAGAFAGALLIGQIVCIWLFDRLRGIPWWEAPLVAALIGGLAFTLVFHAATGGAWDETAWPRLAVLAGVQLIWAAGQLLPTAMLRRAIRPAPGFGGA
jgi:uncharacterized PurR-regulated membrane protein YhhQ (DUF165 family)